MPKKNSDIIAPPFSKILFAVFKFTAGLILSRGLPNIAAVFPYLPSIHARWDSQSIPIASPLTTCIPQSDNSFVNFLTYLRPYLVGVLDPITDITFPPCKKEISPL